MKTVEERFEKYESLAVFYANKVFQEKLIGLDKDDVKQEFRIKLYEIILAYDRSVVNREERKMIRPVPLQYYIKGSFGNFIKDYIKKIKTAQQVFVDCNSNSTKDYAVYDPNNIEIDSEENVFKINGFDLLEPLEGLEKTIFSMYLKGTPVSKLKSVFGKKTNVSEVVRLQKNYLKAKKDLFQLENVQEIFITEFQEA